MIDLTTAKGLGLAIPGRLRGRRRGNRVRSRIAAVAHSRLWHERGPAGMSALMTALGGNSGPDILSSSSSRFEQSRTLVTVTANVAAADPAGMLGLAEPCVGRT